METIDLADMETIFTQEEAWNTIRDLPPDRAPGPDGFVGAFYQRAWPIIKHDLMAVMLKLYVEDGRGFGRLNRAHIVLIPKKADAEEIGDFRPISLTHSATKLFAKMLANRAQRRMKELVAANQSAFITGRNLHDNFLLVRQVARKIYARKEAGVFLKLDISRAFDSIAWPFLFDVLRNKGFGQKWLAWISILLKTSTTRVVVNGIPGRSFTHVKGLRQGDPISPLLFVIALDVLTKIMNKAAMEGVVSSYTGITPTQRLSIFADDVALFVRPTDGDLSFVRAALQAFGDASGLKVNYSKSSAVLIRGDVADQQRVASMLQCSIGAFPCKYLGLQLAINQLSRTDWQPMLDKAKRCVPAWQRGMIQKPGRLILVKSIISARPIHSFMVMDAPAWVFEKLDQWMRAFFGRAKKKPTAGIAWWPGTLFASPRALVG